MLTSLQVEDVHGIKKLILETPRLRDIKILDCSYDMSVEIVHSESVERLLIDWLDYTEVKKLKNLKTLCFGDDLIDTKFLSSLQQLKEIHFQNN